MHTWSPCPDRKNSSTQKMDWKSRLNSHRTAEPGVPPSVTWSNRLVTTAQPAPAGRMPTQVQVIKCLDKFCRYNLVRLWKGLVKKGSYSNTSRALLQTMTKAWSTTRHVCHQGAFFINKNPCYNATLNYTSVVQPRELELVFTDKNQPRVLW